MTAISPEETPLVYPVGHHACGKSKVSEYLVNQYGFNIIETGAMVRAAYRQIDPDRERYPHIGGFVASVEAENPDFFIEMILDDMQSIIASKKPYGMIINGMRTLTHLRRMQRRTPDHPQAVVWIDSPVEVLKQRWELREGHELTDEEFEALLQFDSRLGLDEIRSLAHATVLNDGSVDTLNARVERSLHDLGIITMRKTVGIAED